MSLFFFQGTSLKGVKLAKRKGFPGGREADEVSKVHMGQIKQLGFVPGICFFESFFLFLMSCE